MKISKIYVSFNRFETQEAKRQYILKEMIDTSSEEFVSSLINSEEISIMPSRPYNDSIGCPVVFFGPPQPKNKRRCFREINGRFPLLQIKNIISNLYQNSKGIPND